MATVFVAVLGVLGYTLLYAGSTGSGEATSSDHATQCSKAIAGDGAYSIEESTKHCDWEKRKGEAKASCSWSKKSSCSDKAKGECSKKKKCDWDEQRSETEAAPEIEFN